jgi:hypothetical protein
MSPAPTRTASVEAPEETAPTLEEGGDDGATEPDATLGEAVADATAAPPCDRVSRPDNPASNTIVAANATTPSAIDRAIDPPSDAGSGDPVTGSSGPTGSVGDGDGSPAGGAASGGSVPSRIAAA